MTPTAQGDDPPAPRGTRLGRYVLDERIGVGGMAEVYRAHAQGAFDVALPVAIKWIKPGIVERPDVVSMFVTEARISTRLRHPNIVAVTDFDRDEGGRLYLVMELVDGVDLATLAVTGALPAPAIVHIATELARGLGFAHELPDVRERASDDVIARDVAEPAAWRGLRGVVHRDVSPQNTLLSWHGAVKLSDFGIAKLRAATMASATLHLTGKPAYMSPEQARGQPLDGRSDLFALGVMMWELACGRRLFGGGGPRDALARLLYAPIPDPRRARPELADDLTAVIMRLLSRPADGRPASARELVALLRGCRDAPADGPTVLAGVLVERFGPPSARVPPSTAGAHALQRAATVTRAPVARWYDRAVPTRTMVTPEAWRAAGELVRWRDHDVYVRTGGSGDALLLVHGFPTASWDWWPLWAPLTARFRVVTCDLLGYGFSAKPRGHAYRIVDQAELLLAVLAHAGVTRCRVLAHDYGDTVAQELLARRREGSLPVTLDAVCLLNGGLFPEAHRALRTQKLLASRLGPLLVRFTGKRRFAASMRAIWGAQPVGDEELDAMWTLVARDRGVHALPPLLDYLAQRRANRERWVGALTDPANASGPSRLPLRYVCGMADPISGAHMAARYRELVPSPDVVELPGVGHYPQLEAPELVLAAALSLFSPGS